MAITEFEKNIINFPEQLTVNRVNYFFLENLTDHPLDSLIICGMGGSALAGRILQNIAPEINLPLPVIIWSDYDLPPHPFKNPLFIFISFSGNTAETLSGFLQAETAAKSRVVIAAGGRLKQLAEQSRIPLATFPASTLQPRQATGYYFYALLGLLKKIFPAIKTINLDDHLDAEKNRPLGKNLAEKLARKTIIIYSTSRNAHLAYNWKDRLNETGKELAFWNTIPEMCHNEIVSFETKPDNLIALFLTDPDDHPENKKRVVLLQQLFAERNISSLPIILEGNNIFEKTFLSLNLADWTAFYLAIIKNVDPVAIQAIDQLKQLMA